MEGQLMPDLGGKLQKVAEKVYKKLQTQDAPVYFDFKNVTAPSKIGLPYASASLTTITVASGLKLGSATNWDAVSNDGVAVGDLTLTVPCHLLPEAHLQGCTIRYKADKFRIASWQPSSIVGGKPVKWRIICKRFGND
jgi:hypothetical protein